MANFNIGTITKPQGIKGELRVYPTTDDPSRFELLVGESITITHHGATSSHRLTAARLQKGVVILKLDGIDDRNTAETMQGAVISIPAEKALPLDENEFYVRDLIGLAATDENGTELGILTQVLHTGANDVYEITPQDNKPFLVPAIKEVVLGVDIPGGKIILHIPEGLR